MKSFHLVDDSMTGVLEGYTNSLEAGIDLRFGLRINLCNDIKSKDKEYNLKEFKVIIFCKNKSGYERLLQIYSIGSTEGFYYAPRVDQSSRNHVLTYCGDKYSTQEVKSIYYKNKSDFPHYLTFRCISDSNPGRAKKTLAKPNFDHMCSNEFSFESWYEKI